MKRSMLLCLSVALFGVSCERHEFDGPDGTRKLHEKHSAAHGDGQAAADEHGAAKQEEKPAENAH